MSAQITITAERPTLEERYNQRTRKALADVIEEAAREVMQRAVASWPVGPEPPLRNPRLAGRPHSRDEFYLESESGPDGIFAVINNTAEYVPYIRKPWPQGIAFADVLIERPLERASNELGPRLSAAISESFSG